MLNPISHIWLIYNNFHLFSSKKIQYFPMEIKIFPHFFARQMMQRILILLISYKYNTYLRFRYINLLNSHIYLISNDLIQCAIHEKRTICEVHKLSVRFSSAVRGTPESCHTFALSTGRNNNPNDSEKLIY